MKLIISLQPYGFLINFDLNYELYLGCMLIINWISYSEIGGRNTHSVIKSIFYKI